jgi:hypothetical protein
VTEQNRFFSGEIDFGRREIGKANKPHPRQRSHLAFSGLTNIEKDQIAAFAARDRVQQPGSLTGTHSLRMS